MMKNLSIKWIAWNLFLALIVLAGVYAYYLQLVEGPVHTGATDMVPWGIHIVAFAYFVGASAGATIIGLMIHGFGREDYEPFAIRAILVGLMCLIGSIFFIITDIGNVLNLIPVPWVYMNTTSPFFYTSTSYYLFACVLIAELYYSMKSMLGVAKPWEKKTAKWLAILAVPYALVILHAITGSLFAFIKAREFWNSPLLPAHFALSALASGTAIVLAVALFTPKLIKRDVIGDKTLSHLASLLAAFSGVTIFFDVFDFLIINFSATPEGMEAWHILTGEHLPFFIMNMGGLIGALIILLFKKGRTNRNWMGFAALLVIFSIAAYRYNLVVVGMKVPEFNSFGKIHYTPSFHDMTIIVGIIACIFLAYSVATKILPLEPKEKSE